MSNVLSARYSGDASEAFWAVINATGDDAIYALGCALQDLEHQVLEAIKHAVPVTCQCSIQNRGDRSEHNWLKDCMCMYHWMQTDHYQAKLELEKKLKQDLTFDEKASII